MAALTGAWVRPLLSETSVLHPMVLSTVAVVLLASTLLACLGPANHASKVDPVRSLTVGWPNPRERPRPSVSPAAPGKPPAVTPEGTGRSL